MNPLESSHSIEKKVPLNNMLAILMQDHGVTQSEIASCIRWRNQLPGGTQVDHGEEHPIEPQQQHTKTIIVDGEVTLAGSANFDIASLSGAFRELSVAVRDQQTASESISRFNAIFESDEHSAPYESAFPKPLSFWGVVAQKIVHDILVTESWRIGNLDPAKLFA